jgi:hypothetical protein
MEVLVELHNQMQVDQHLAEVHLLLDGLLVVVVELVV